MVQVVNWVSEYKARYWKAAVEVVRAQRPSRIRVFTQVRWRDREVKGAATEASAAERDRPTSAAFRAAQSFAPSPVREGGW